MNQCHCDLAPGVVQGHLAQGKRDWGHFALMRLDGDTFESTWQALTELYDLLSPGGFVIVDDYTDWVGCRRAVNEFLVMKSITPKLRPVAHGPGEQIRGVWWQK